MLSASIAVSLSFCLSCCFHQLVLLCRLERPSYVFLLLSLSFFVVHINYSRPVLLLYIMLNNRDVHNISWVFLNCNSLLFLSWLTEYRIPVQEANIG